MPGGNPATRPSVSPGSTGGARSPVSDKGLPASPFDAILGGEEVQI
jgi:hypothetical protein